MLHMNFAYTPTMKFINKSRTHLLVMFILSGCNSVQKDATPPSDRALWKNNYENLKSLSGDWHLVGGHRLGKKIEPNTAEPFLSYSISAGGHAVVEKLFVDKPNEMVSIYYLDSGRLNMDHYCSLGNQPRMVAVPSEDYELAFKLIAVSNMTDKNDLHISSHAFEFHGPDELTVYWGATKEQNESNGSVYKVKRNDQTRTHP